ncbi:hypothetical protein [Embleya sp. NPDC020886]|uniref:hypothetical protein n=1 Tax=Embleya sp. NPDC020886 TaxID=3363980 RepID=UPI0037BB890D
MAGGGSVGGGGSARVRVETGALRQGAAAAREVAGALRQAAGKPGVAVVGCFGFAVAAAAGALTAAWADHLRALADGYGGLGEVLTANADAHDRTDQAAAGAFAEARRRW